VAQAEEDLRQTAITQPAVLATDAALTRLMAAYGIRPDMTMGHSLGEYGALVASGGLPFGDALEAVSARGREMTRVSMADNGKMAAVFAPIDQVERILKSVDGYVVVANINSERQAVIGGAFSFSWRRGMRRYRSPSAMHSIQRLWPRPVSRCGKCSSACTWRVHKPRS
jgi:malonyl CoA-acyl carrier protein transacylase